MHHTHEHEQGGMVIHLKRRQPPQPQPSVQEVAMPAPQVQAVTPQPQAAIPPVPPQPTVDALDQPESEPTAPVIQPPAAERQRAVSKVRTPFVLPRYTYHAIGALAVAGIVFAGGWYAYGRIFHHPEEPLTEQTVVEKIGKHILLPGGETPTIATVTDSNKLKNQLFFKNAQTGDIVLVYVNAGRAILYSPTEDKVIEVAPVTSGTP